MFLLFSILCWILDRSYIEICKTACLHVILNFFLVVMLQTSYPQQLNSDNDVVMTMLHQIEQDSCLT